MIRPKLQAVSMLALALCGCPNTTTSTPPVAGALAAASACPTQVPQPSPVLADMAGFRDDFSGSALDTQKWRIFTQTGLYRLENGMLDILNTNNQPNFPYLLTKQDVVPHVGPFYVEFSYSFISVGHDVSFSLDYLPPEAPNEKPLTSPLMTTGGFYNALQFRFQTETGPVTFEGPNGILPSTQHVFRLENDGKNNYRAMFDHREIGSFQSQRRPKRFWVGSTPVEDIDATAWPRIQIDYVDIGVMNASEVATTPDVRATAPLMPSPL